MAQVSQVQTDNGISWYVEQRGSGPHIILIPSGEGDCGSFDRLSSLICNSFTVTIFDMPGFSRSTCPPSALANLTPAIIASQIVSLMDALSIAKATVYGSSSGGLFSIALLQHHPSRIERIIIHEVPMKRLSTLDPVIAFPDEKIPEHCKGIFANFFNEDQAKWEALGEEYHTRLEQNYITWLRSYPPMLDAADWGKEGMGKLEDGIWWSVGALMPMGSFFDNVVFCAELGIPIRKLNSKHFPHVSIAEDLAEYIVGCRR